jgi:uncharacterized protein
MTDPNYAGFWRRALASLLDNVVWFLFFVWIYAWIVGGAAAASDAAGIVAVLAFLSLWFNYFALCEWRWGQTIGKNATGIQVRSVDGAERLTYGQASIRNLLRLVDFFGIGELMIAAGKRKQRLGDKAARTIVIRRGPSPRWAAPADPAPATAAMQGGAEPSPPLAAVPPEPEEADQSRLPTVHWGVRDSVWGLIGGLLLVVIVPPLLVLPFDPNIGDPDKASDAGILATQALFDVFLVVIAIGMASQWRFKVMDSLRLLGLRRFEPSALGWMFAVLGAYYAGAILFSAIVIQPKQEDIGKELGVCNPGIGIAIAAVLSVVVIAPLAEEIFFRGFFFAGLRSRWSLWPSALLSGGIFGLVHAPTGPTAAIPLAGLGVGLAWLYNRTGSLWPCVLAHLLNNALAISVVVTQC